LYVDVEKEFQEGFAGLIVSRARDYSSAEQQKSITEKVIIDGVSLK
jgi:hypothetical protein